jgi:hypothetical protein
VGKVEVANTCHTNNKFCSYLFVAMNGRCCNSVRDDSSHPFLKKNILPQSCHALASSVFSRTTTTTTTDCPAG